MEKQMVSAGGLHALAYCERLYYLENVEAIRIADERVFAGRAEHEKRLPKEDGSWARLRYESEELGLRGEVDILRRVDGALVPYELKRGRSAGKKGAREAWATDELQVGAYALLAEEQFGQEVTEGRVHYAADGVTIRVPVDAALRSRVRSGLSRARELSLSVERPPVTSHENRCTRCSLAGACLPEETRLAADPKWRPIRLLPAHTEGSPLHVLESGARVGRSGNTLKVTKRDGTSDCHAIADVNSVTLHGFSQISSQALRLCADREVPVHWVTAGGGVIGSLSGGCRSAQRHLRQFAALSEQELALSLSKQLVRCKIEAQMRFLLRATRGERPMGVKLATVELRRILRQLPSATNQDSLLGHEGNAARLYFAALPKLLSDHVDEALSPVVRTRRPAADRFSALLNYGYGMLYRQVLGAILAVGLHPGVGFYHKPRSSAQALGLDIMELFRVPLVDMTIIAALNRRTFSTDSDFCETGNAVSLSESGRKKLIELTERRLQESWKHTAVGYSLSYARIIELEVRLLEKEWQGEGGLFAQLRIR